MPEVALKVGPVLSFRGISHVAGVAKWCVTALIGVKAEGPPPVLMLSGQACPPPVFLHDHGGVKYWRYDLSVEMEPAEQRFTYGFGIPAQTWAFSVPKAGVAPRAAYVSCNGYGDPPVMRKLVRPANAAWADLLSNHDKSLRPVGYRIDKEQIWHEQKIHDQNLQRFHLLLMGGDQIYFDSIWEDIADLKAWVNLSREKQLKYNVTSRDRSCRATIVSGDVHVAAWGVIHRQDLPPTANWGQIQQFTSSAIVHPSLSGVFERVFLSFLNSAASKAQYIDVDHRVEMMLFPGHNQYMMATRNWLALEMDDDSASPRLWATWRCEAPDNFTNHLYVVKPFNAGAS